MAERDQRGRVIKALRVLDAVSVENKVYPGHPDVNYIGGDMELKWIRAWPRNCDESAVLIPHFKPQQRVWLKRRWRRGGRCWLLLQVRAEWFLFDGLTAGQSVGRLTRPDLVARACRYWPKGLVDKELVACVSAPRD